MYNISDFWILAIRALVILMVANVLKNVASESENAVKGTKQAVNTTIYWHWGGDQELQNITQEVKNTADILKTQKTLMHNLLDAVKSNNETINNMNVQLQNISLRLNALEDITLKNALKKSSYHRSCADILRNKDVKDGVYTLVFDTQSELQVYCQHDPLGGPAWTIVQRLSNRNFSFEREWDAFENGFGDVDKDHWLGLKNIYKLQNMLNGSMELLIYEKYNISEKYGMYANFSIESSSLSYALKSAKLYNNSKDYQYYDDLKNSLGRKFTLEYINCKRLKAERKGWWCDKEGECCYGANRMYRYFKYVYMGVRPNPSK